MENQCSFTMKDAKGDTIKEYIYRYSTYKDTIMIDAYLKYEDKMLIQKIYEPLFTSAEDKRSLCVKNAKALFRWNSPRFIKLFIRLTY